MAISSLTSHPYTNNTTYMAICNLTENTVRVQIYNVDQTSLALGTLYYDTTVINDASYFPRRAGRVGFSSSLNDGDSYIGSIRPRGMMFAEYRSKPLTSITPVSGARLYVQNTAPVELYSIAASVKADTVGNVPILTKDQQRYLPSSTTQSSTRVTIVTPTPASVIPQGVVTNVLTPPDDSISGITDFDQLHIKFSLWIPSAALNGPLLNGVQFTPDDRTGEYVWSSNALARYARSLSIIRSLPRRSTGGTTAVCSERAAATELILGRPSRSSVRWDSLTHAPVLISWCSLLWHDQRYLVDRRCQCA